MQTVTKAEVLEIITYADDLKEFILKPEKYRRFDAGTFLQLTLEDVTASDRWPESRTFSMASAYNKKNKTMRLLIRKVGNYTERIFNELKVGSTCTIKYDFGEMILPQFDSVNPIICIAGGTGIAPFLSFVEELEREGELARIKVLYSVREESDFIGYDYLKKTLEDSQLTLFCTDKKSEKGLFRLMTDKDITKDLEEPSKAHYYICGSPEFITHFKENLIEQGIKNIYLDEWD